MKHCLGYNRLGHTVLFTQPFCPHFVVFFLVSYKCCVVLKAPLLPLYRMLPPLEIAPSSKETDS